MEDTDIAAVSEALAGSTAPLFVTHRHADRDSLGSAIGLRALLDRGSVCTPDGVAGPAQSLLETTGTDPVVDPTAVAADTVVVLDAPSTERIAPVTPTNPVLVDHHEPGDLVETAQAAVVDTSAGATAELVARLADHTDRAVTPDVALPLLVGLLDDTGFLAGAPPESVRTAVRLVGHLGDRATELPAVLDWSPGDGERTARALGTLRATGYRAGDFVVAVTRIGGHETAVTHALRDADIDFVAACADQGDELRVTTRASTAFAEEVNLGETLLPALADEFGGDGGGHAGAGVAHLDSGTVDEVEATLVAMVERELGMTFGTVS